MKSYAKKSVSRRKFLKQIGLGAAVALGAPAAVAAVGMIGIGHKIDKVKE